MRFGALALLPQLTQAHGGAQLQPFHLVASDDIQGVPQPDFRRLHIAEIAKTHAGKTRTDTGSDITLGLG
jgi:hypothetical protein